MKSHINTMEKCLRCCRECKNVFKNKNLSFLK